MTQDREAQAGDRVVVHYTGRFEDGTVFDTSRDESPVEFHLGTGQVIPGFEQAIVGMRPGEQRTARLPPENAYGTPRDDLRFRVPRANLPEGLAPEVGQVLEMRDAEGAAAPVVVVEADAETVTLDANHPLAGRTLVFDIELLNIA